MAKTCCKIIVLQILFSDHLFSQSCLDAVVSNCLATLQQLRPCDLSQTADTVYSVVDLVLALFNKQKVIPQDIHLITRYILECSWLWLMMVGVLWVKSYWQLMPQSRMQPSLVLVQFWNMSSFELWDVSEADLYVVFFFFA